MEKAELSMIENLAKKTGKTLDQWIKIVKAENFEKHGQIVKFLKEKHSFTHGYADIVAHKSRGSDAGSTENKDELIDKSGAFRLVFKNKYLLLIALLMMFLNWVNTTGEYMLAQSVENTAKSELITRN